MTVHDDLTIWRSTGAGFTVPWRWSDWRGAGHLRLPLGDRLWTSSEGCFQVSRVIQGSETLSGHQLVHLLQGGIKLKNSLSTIVGVHFPLM